MATQVIKCEADCQYVVAGTCTLDEITISDNYDCENFEEKEEESDEE